MSDKTVIIIRETLFGSIVKDAFTFGALMVLPWFNHTYGGGSGWIYAAIAFAWFIGIISRASGEFAKSTKTPAEAKRWLAETYPD